MISTRDIDDIIGAEALDQNDAKIGKVGQVYLEQGSDEPVWVSVRSGLFGTSETLVPLSGADWDRNALHLAFSKDRVKDAPRVEPDAELSPQEQERLYDYYGMGGGDDRGAGDAGGAGTRPGVDDPVASDRDRYTAAGGGEGALGGMDRDRLDADDRDRDRSSGDRFAAEGAGAAGAAGAMSGDRAGFVDGDREDRDDRFGDQRGAVGHDTSGPTTDDAMTRSEERLNVGTERVQTGRARLRKYVVTEQQTVTVPTTREEVRVEREPITDANRGDALDGPDLSDEEHEVVLTEERPVVEKETVPVERVRLGTETVADQQQVTEDVRREEIDTDGDGATGRRR